jgi:predicted nucleic acid-binding protein
VKVLIDSNIVLDLILRRAPWFVDAAQIVAACETGALEGALPASVLTDIFYVTRRATDLATAFSAVDLCLRLFVLLSVDQMTVERARQIPGNDFEDAIVLACAAIAGVDALVTRDRAGFAAAPMTVLTPGELLARL